MGALDSDSRYPAGVSPFARCSNCMVARPRAPPFAEHQAIRRRGCCCKSVGFAKACDDEAGASPRQRNTRYAVALKPRPFVIVRERGESVYRECRLPEIPLR